LFPADSFHVSAQASPCVAGIKQRTILGGDSEKSVQVSASCYALPVAAAVTKTATVCGPWPPPLPCNIRPIVFVLFFPLSPPRSWFCYCCLCSRVSPRSSPSTLIVVQRPWGNKPLDPSVAGAEEASIRSRKALLNAFSNNSAAQSNLLTSVLQMATAIPCP
jgi:hypothetical protein